jgi:RimJ/RimL family protein N-acetyltransferase
VIIRPAESKDSVPCVRHMQTHMAESGGEGRIIFHPVEDFGSWDVAEFASRLEQAWNKPLAQPGWERRWLLDEEGQILGDARLRGPLYATALHRCTLGMGIQESARGLGHGRDFLETLISWARAQESLFWIDLEVFSHNTRAIQLYESFGFLTYGVTMDLYRVHGHSVDAMQMSLQLREE